MGDGVDEFSVGDHVLGFSFRRSSHATYVSVPTSQLIHKPASAQLGGCRVSLRRWLHRLCGRTCRRCQGRERRSPSRRRRVGSGPWWCSCWRCVVRAVLGIASQANADWLRSHGAVPVPYGDGLAERLRAAAGERIDAFIDLFGPEYLELAVELGIPRDRIETIASFEKAQELGVKAEGSAPPPLLKSSPRWPTSWLRGRSTFPSRRRFRWIKWPMPSQSWSSATPEGRSSSSLD